MNHTEFNAIILAITEDKTPDETLNVLKTCLETIINVWGEEGAQALKGYARAVIMGREQDQDQARAREEEGPKDQQPTPQPCLHCHGMTTGEATHAYTYQCIRTLSERIMSIYALNPELNR